MHREFRWFWRPCVAVFALVSAAAGQSSEPDPTSPFLPLEVLSEVTYPETGNRYQLISLTDYLNANKFAEDSGGWLWSVNSADEMNFVIDQFLPTRNAYLAEYANGTRTLPEAYAGSTPDGDFYIGFTDSEFFGAEEGNFQWINGDPVTYTNWSGGEPNNVGTDTDPNGEDYAEIWNLSTSRNWNDDNDRGSGLNGLPNLGRLPAGGNLAVIEFDPLPPPAFLEIDPASGFARLVSDIENPLMLFSYEIRSEAGMISDVAWESSNLSPGGEAVLGQDWQSISAGPNQVFEGYLLGGTELAPGESILLGKVTEPFDPTGETPDLVLDIATSNRNPAFAGTVTAFDVPIRHTPFLPGSLPGDYKADGVVDAADYTVWRDGELAADGDGNGVVDGVDYRIWAGQYGATAATTAAVPEPTAWLAAVLAVVLGVGARRD